MQCLCKRGAAGQKKEGKKVSFSLDRSVALWIRSNESILDALDFYQLAGNFGIVGNVLTEQFDHHNQTFRVKHSFFVHSLEDEILSALLETINQKKSVRLEMKSSRQKKMNQTICIPLQIFTSTRSGRRFLCSYVQRNKRFTCFRLDAVKRITAMEPVIRYDELYDKLLQNRRHLWGVSFQSTAGHRLDRLKMTVQIMEPAENYILNRLRYEGRGGTITKTGENIYQYETEVFDCNEMLPWIRTFTGRILSLECTARSVEKRFYQDLQTMYHMYLPGTAYNGPDKRQPGKEQD